MPTGLCVRAEVRGGMVVGYPFLKACGLCVDPVADCLRDCLTQSTAVIKSQAESVQAVSGAVHASQCACAVHSALSSSVVADPDSLLVKKVPTRTGPRCAPSACYPC